MEKDFASRPFSSQVSGWLTIEGIQHELAQVGPGFCIVREPLTVEWSDGSEQRVELIIEVDGAQRCVAVEFPLLLLYRTVVLQGSGCLCNLSNEAAEFKLRNLRNVNTTFRHHDSLQ